ncbi:MAG: hypothetical protein ABIG99_00675 [Patescibacteria group bacterium]
MIGRKFLMLQNGQKTYQDDTEKIFKTQHLEEFKHSLIKTIKKYIYLGLVTTIRLYFRFKNLFLSKYQKIKIKIKNIRDKNKNINPENKREISKFLRIISEYKQKIREIKHKIKEEESNS